MEFEKLRDIISEVLNIDASAITLQTRFVEDLGADSLDVFQIIMEIEKYFQITIEDFQAEHIVTVEDAVEQIRSSIR